MRHLRQAPAVRQPTEPIPSTMHKATSPSLGRAAPQTPRTAYAALPPASVFELREAAAPYHRASALGTHDLAVAGLPADQVQAFLDSFQAIPRAALVAVLGISQRTLERALADQRALDPNASDRALRLLGVLQRAIDTFGSRPAAEQWLAAPAIGLEGRTPLELLQSSEGTDIVKTLLGRMDHGVYA